MAYLAARYDDAAALVTTANRPLGLWVRAKLALRKGDRDGAVRDWTAAMAAAGKGAPDQPLDEEAAIRLRGEAAVLQVARGQYEELLKILFPVASSYWGDVTYIAERVLTVDELKKVVDTLPVTEAAALSRERLAAHCRSAP